MAGVLAYLAPGRMARIGPPLARSRPRDRGNTGRKSARFGAIRHRPIEPGNRRFRTRRPRRHGAKIDRPRARHGRTVRAARAVGNRGGPGRFIIGQGVQDRCRGRCNRGRRDGCGARGGRQAIPSDLHRLGGRIGSGILIPPHTLAPPGYLHGGRGVCGERPGIKPETGPCRWRHILTGQSRRCLGPGGHHRGFGRCRRLAVHGNGLSLHLHLHLGICRQDGARKRVARRIGKADPGGHARRTIPGPCGRCKRGWPHLVRCRIGNGPTRHGRHRRVARANCHKGRRFGLNTGGWPRHRFGTWLDRPLRERGSADHVIAGILIIWHGAGARRRDRLPRRVARPAVAGQAGRQTRLPGRSGPCTGVLPPHWGNDLQHLNHVGLKCRLGQGL